jgi:hypothetical protein
VQKRGKEREAGEEARQCLDATNLTTSGVGLYRLRRPNTRPGGEFLSGEKERMREGIWGTYDRFLEGINGAWSERGRE